MGISHKIKMGLVGLAFGILTGCMTLSGNPEGPVIRASLHHAVTVTGNGGSGSGVWVGEDLILTAKHVVSFADRSQTVQIHTLMGDVIGAQLIAEGPGQDVEHDWALLRVDPAHKRQHYASFSCEPVEYGQRVISLGNPGGVTGIMAFIGRVQMAKFEIDQISGEDYLWHHGFTVSHEGYPGVSGGPTFNMDGELVGIVVADIIKGTAKAVYPVQYISALCGEHED